MNNIQEKDWAEDAWSGHTGMDCDSHYCTGPVVDDEKKAEKDVSSAQPAQHPFAIDYEFIRRGEVEVVFRFKESNLPVRALFFSDPLLDLTESALQLHEGAGNASVVFMGNDGEHHLVFQREQERELAFEIRWVEKGENVGRDLQDRSTVAFKGTTTVDEYCLQVLNILSRIEQNIGVKQYKTKWINADFPSEAYWKLKLKQDG